MQAIIQAKELREAVKQAGRVAGKRSSMPILEAVRIDAGLEGLTVSATNLETWGRTSVECLTQTDAGPNSVLVDARLIAKLTGKLSGEVLLSAPKAGEDLPYGTSGVLTIGGSVIPTMPLEDYPETPASVPGHIIGALEGAAFKGLVKRLKAASCKYASATRLPLTGINVIYGEGRVKFAATDGYRLLLEEYAADCTESGAVLIDAGELARIATLAKNTDSVTLEVIPADLGDPSDSRRWIGKQAQLVVSFASARYTLRGIPEEFPDFERVIPKDNPIEFTVNRKTFLAAIQRGMIVASEMSGAVTLGLIPYGTQTCNLEMSSDSRDKGSYHELMRIDGDISAPCEPVSFNGALLEDVCKLGKSPSVRVALGGRLQAGRFSTDSDNVAGRLSQAWVVMPVNQNT